jgi:hypothetical protein
MDDQEHVGDIIEDTANLIKDIDDSEECLDYLNEFPERCSFFWCHHHSKVSLVLIGCLGCKKILGFPPKVIYHCIRDKCCEGNYCPDCYLKAKCKEFYIDSLYNIYHRFHIWNVHVSTGTATDIEYKDFFRYCSPVKDILDVKREKEEEEAYAQYVRDILSSSFGNKFYKCSVLSSTY